MQIQPDHSDLWAGGPLGFELVEENAGFEPEGENNCWGDVDPPFSFLRDVDRGREACDITCYNDRILPAD